MTSSEPRRDRYAASAAARRAKRLNHAIQEAIAVMLDSLGMGHPPGRHATALRIGDADFTTELKRRMVLPPGARHTAGDPRVSQMQWRRMRASTDPDGWSDEALRAELFRLDNTMREERRIPPTLMGDGALTAERIVLGLALAREGSQVDASTDPVIKNVTDEVVGELIWLAVEIITKSGPDLTAGDWDRLKAYHGWLEELSPQGPNWKPVIDNPRSWISGLLGGRHAALKLQTLSPASGGLVDLGLIPPTDGYGIDYWVEGALEGLVFHGAYRTARTLARKSSIAQTERPAGVRGVRIATEYLTELLWMKSFALPGIKRRAQLRRKAENLLPISEELRNGDPSIPVVQRRTQAVSHILRKDWSGALVAASKAADIQISTGVEVEYGFDVLAAIAHEAASKGTGNTEPIAQLITIFLTDELARGRGPFMAFGVRELAAELRPECQLPRLTTLSKNLAGATAGLEGLTELIQIANIFNAASLPYSATEITALAAALDALATAVDDTRSLLDRYREPSLRDS